MPFVRILCTPRPSLSSLTFSNPLTVLTELLAPSTIRVPYQSTSTLGRILDAICNPQAIPSTPHFDTPQIRQQRECSREPLQPSNISGYQTQTALVIPEHKLYRASCSHEEVTITGNTPQNEPTPTEQGGHQRMYICIGRAGPWLIFSISPYHQTSSDFSGYMASYQTRKTCFRTN